jgi:hypothetical protein
MSNESGVLESKYFQSGDRIAHLNETITCLWHIAPKNRRGATTSVLFDVVELPAIEGEYKATMGTNALTNQFQAGDKGHKCDDSKLLVGEGGRHNMDYFSFMPLRMCGNLTALNQYFVFRRMQYENPTIFLQYRLTAKHRGVRVKYQTQACGGEFMSGGNFSSPGYLESGNGVYPPNSLCQWTVMSKFIDELELQFLSFHLESDCSTDYVEVFAGTSAETSPRIGRYCGRNAPQEALETKSRVFTVVFQSDATGSAPGFKFRVQKVESRTSCGGRIQHQPGNSVNTLSTLNYPKQYPDNLECVWLFEFSRSYHFQMTFTSRFDIEQSINCTSDYVLIEQKAEKGWEHLGKYCGLHLPPETNSTSNIVRVTFRSNGNVSGDGFQMQVQQVCGGTFTALSGYIEVI